MFCTYRVSALYQRSQETLPDVSRYFYGLDLPDEVFEHPAVQRLDEIARELIVMCVHRLCDAGNELTRC